MKHITYVRMTQNLQCCHYNYSIDIHWLGNGIVVAGAFCNCFSIQILVTADKVKVCKRGYDDPIEDSDYCYKMHKNGKTFNQVHVQCQRDGGKPLQIANDHENEKMLQYTRNKVDQSGSVWLGLRQTANNNYHYVAENKLSVYQRWAKGQPNALFPLNCVSMQSSGNDVGFWKVNACDDVHSFVCMSKKEGNIAFSYTFLVV